jgi:rifampicin phosphotransferase
VNINHKEEHLAVTNEAPNRQEGEPSMQYTKRFDEIGKDDIALAGGKGANLGELKRAGLPVPPGFVLTTAAYDAFVESNGIGGEIVGFASAPRAEDPAAFAQVSERIHPLFSGGEVPEEMEGEIRAAYERLVPDGETAVAVRSSATAEDLAGASFAGQQETFLNVRGAEALIEAVKDCWGSLWTARAMAYRRRQNIEPATVSLAVVVQEMVEAEAAGVMFTANPANGRRDQAAISAAWGLGESVVSGSVTTDDAVVEKDTGRILSRETADKAVMTVYTEYGTEERPVPEARRRQPVLDDETVAKLARYGARIENHYGSPHDVGARGRRNLRGAGAADHRPARADGRPADRLERAGSEGHVRTRQHRRADARPALAPFRRPRG